MDSTDAKKHERSNADERHGQSADHPESLGVIGALHVYHSLRKLLDGQERIEGRQRAIIAGQRDLTALVVDFIEHQASDEADRAELKRQLRIRLDRLKALGVDTPPT